MTGPHDLRLCPACGVRMAAGHCPEDGMATVVTYGYNANAVLRPGDVVGERYVVQDVLGRGGYGSVYAATHVITRQEVALKVLQSAFGGPDDAMIRRFFREARVTAALSHPNTVRVFDVGQTPGGAFFLAMERLDGPSLEAVLTERGLDGGTLTEVEAIDIGVAVLRSLQEAHGHRLVHRDLKPANIVLADFGDGEPVVKVLDFGIALTDGSSLTTSGMALGTPAYMSPEQCEATVIDGRSDLYSLGIILYRCVTGDVPFNDHNPVAIMQAHLDLAPPPVTRHARTPLSAGFVAVVERALRKAPDDRFQSAQAMRQALEAVRRDAWQDTPVDLPAMARTGQRAAIRAGQAAANTVPIDLPDAVPTVLAPAAVAVGPTAQLDPAGRTPRHPRARKWTLQPEAPGGPVSLQARPTKGTILMASGANDAALERERLQAAFERVRDVARRIGDRGPSDSDT